MTKSTFYKCEIEFTTGKFTETIYLEVYHILINRKVKISILETIQINDYYDLVSKENKIHYAKNSKVLNGLVFPSASGGSFSESMLLSKANLNTQQQELNKEVNHLAKKLKIKLMPKASLFTMLKNKGY